MKFRAKQLFAALCLSVLRAGRGRFSRRDPPGHAMPTGASGKLLLKVDGPLSTVHWVLGNDSTYGSWNICDKKRDSQRGSSNGRGTRRNCGSGHERRKRERRSRSKNASRSAGERALSRRSVSAGSLGKRSLPLKELRIFTCAGNLSCAEQNTR